MSEPVNELSSRLSIFSIQVILEVEWVVSGFASLQLISFKRRLTTRILFYKCSQKQNIICVGRPWFMKTQLHLAHSSS